MADTDQIDQFESMHLSQIGDHGCDGCDSLLARLGQLTPCQAGTALHALLRACLCNLLGVADALLDWLDKRRPLRLFISPKVLAYSLAEQQQWSKSQICEHFQYVADSPLLPFVLVTRLADFTPFWPAIEAALAAVVSFKPVISRKTANLEHHYTAQIVRMDSFILVDVRVQTTKTSSTAFLVRLCNSDGLAVIMVAMGDEP